MRYSALMLITLSAIAVAAPVEADRLKGNGGDSYRLSSQEDSDVHLNEGDGKLPAGPTKTQLELDMHQMLQFLQEQVKGADTTLDENKKKKQLKELKEAKSKTKNKFLAIGTILGGALTMAYNYFNDPYTTSFPPPTSLPTN